MLALARFEGALPPADGSLRERVVLVTGATGGLGRATSLAAAAAGATVVLLGRKVRALEALYDEIEKRGGPQPAVYPMDLAGATPRDFADLADAAHREQRRTFAAGLRLDHRDPPVARERVAHQRAITRFEDVQRQLQARKQHRAGKRKDREAGRAQRSCR